MCLLNDFACMCFIKPLNTHNLISDFFSKPLMSTYYVLAQNPTLEGSNKSLQICPSPTLDHKLPVGSVFSSSPQSCVQNTGRAEQWVMLQLWERLPRVAKSQEIPSSGSGLEKRSSF